ncbi:MAG: type IV secretion system DNA-binding domain-containing protein [Candidatus Magasanikbacteria bacterium]
MVEEAPNNPTPAKPVVKVDSEINYFGMTNFRNQNRRFGIKIDDRRRHMYTVGKTGMGKTTMLENMVLNDIYAGHGVGVVDPHGDFAEKIIDFIPPERINDVVYFNPADMDYPIGFNILETIRPEQKHLVASGLMGVFKKIWPDVWSARMEYILNNTLLALLDFPGTTLLGINRLLADPEYRGRVIGNLKDPIVKSFWNTEFAGYNDRYKQEAVAPIQNKIGQFMSASVIRNIVAQVKSRINIREIMDTRKILIMNLSKGRIGEDNSRLLGGMLITKIQLAAMERVDTPEKDRKDFFLYVDEFQNFATESFSNILSEARKYRLALIMAHQYMEQLEEEVLAAVIGNVGTIVSFRVGSTDAEILAKEFIPTFLETDIVNLAKYQVFLKLMIDGISSQPFSAMTLPPIFSQSQHSAEKVIKVSRERYAVPKEKIENKIARWSGMTDGVDDDDEDGDGMGNLPPVTSVPKPATTRVEAPRPSFNKPAPVRSAPASRPPFSRSPQPRPPQNISTPKNISFSPPPVKSGRQDKNIYQRPPSAPVKNQQPQKQFVKPAPKQNDIPVSASEPIVLVDTAQKGLSLADAFKPRESAVKKENKRSNFVSDTSIENDQRDATAKALNKQIEQTPNRDDHGNLMSQPIKLSLPKPNSSTAVILSPAYRQAGETKNLSSSQSPKPANQKTDRPTIIQPGVVTKVENNDEDDAWRYDK